MKFSRRDFIHAGCSVVGVSLVPSVVDKAEAAFPHGSVSVTTNNNRVSLNVRTTAFMNFAKSWAPAGLSPAILDINGYPSGTLTSNYSTGIVLAPNFYGQYAIQWSGLGQMQFIAEPAIVYSGGAAVNGLTSGGGPAGTGYVTGNFSIGNSVSNPSVVFKFGALVASVSGGNGSLVTITTLATLQGFTTGQSVSFNQGCSSNLSSGPNADGSWTITNTGSGPTTFTLNGSTGVISPSVTGSGGVGTQTEAILSLGSPSLTYSSGGTFSGFTALVICKQSNLASIAAGGIWDPVYIAQLQQLQGKPSGVGRGGEWWLRFMDLSAVIGSYEADFSQRKTLTSQPWTGLTLNTPIGYYSTGLTNGGASGNYTDVYTAATNPSASPASGPPVDGEIIQAKAATTNSGARPALTMASGTRSSFGTWPIYDSSNYLTQRIDVTQGVAVGTLASTGCSYNNSTGAITIALTGTISGGTINIGDTVSLSNLTGTNSPNLLNGTHTVASVTNQTNFVLNGTSGLGASITITGGGFSDSTAAVGQSLVFTFSTSAGTWLNGGSPYVATYTTVSGDTNITTLAANLATFFSSNSLNAPIQSAKIVFTNNPLGASAPTALSGYLSIVYTSGPAAISIGSMAPSVIGTSGITTYIFNALLGGFVYNGGQFAQSIPIEAITNLCNLLGANCWYNWPVYTKAAYITACTNLFASSVGSGGLTSGLKFGAEFGNEIWNIGTGLYGRTQCYGIALGMHHMPYGNYDGNYSWQGLMTIQYAALSRAAWASAGRTASQHYVLTMGPEYDTTVSSNFDLSVLQGQYLVTSNSNYANYGTLGGTSLSTSYNTAGSQPVDSSDAIGCAPYWGSPWFEEAAASPSGNGVKGTVTQNAPMLQASIDYANGLSSTAFGELTNQFDGTQTRSGGSSGGITLNPGYTSVFTNEEAQAAQYDSRRTGNGQKVLSILHYEGGPQWGMGANYNNGVNSASSLSTAIASGDITALVNQMTALGWTTTSLIPYTISATGNLTEVATNILQMAQGWKYDTDINGTFQNTGSYASFIKTWYYANVIGISAAKREIHPCEYDGNGSQWGLTWTTYNASQTYYQNFYAMAQQNT